MRILDEWPFPVLERQRYRGRTAQLNVKVRPEFKRRLEQLARAKRASMAEIFEYCVERYGQAGDRTMNARIAITWQQSVFGVVVSAITIVGTAMVVILGGRYVMNGTTACTLRTTSPRK